MLGILKFDIIWALNIAINNSILGIFKLTPIIEIELEELFKPIRWENYCLSKLKKSCTFYLICKGMQFGLKHLQV